MSFSRILKHFIFLSIILYCESLKFASVAKTYEKGVQAYSADRWSECIAQFEESVHLYKLHKGIVINCRLKCNSQQYKSEIELDIDNLKIYEKFIVTKNCLTSCNEKAFEDVRLHNDLDEKILYNMHTRKPYEYLHMCYFQMNNLPKAASAVYTYLVANPNNEVMKNNLKYYIGQPEVDAKDVADLLSEDYEILFRVGLKAYNENNWGDTVTNMEEALRDYFNWENKCRVECEQQPEQESTKEFVSTVANNMASLLHCHQQCQDKLKTLEYNSGVEFVSEILNYLQISYYRLNNYENAAKSVESYLILLPYDEDMLENKKIYRSLVDEKAFMERSDIVYYYKRDTYEKKLINLFHKGRNDIDSNTI